MQISESDLEYFTAHYIGALLWSSVVEDVARGGEYVAANCFELSTAGMDRCRADCRAFATAHCNILAEAIELTGLDSAGHDFALTRNGHGSGYWDRDELSRALGDALTEAAQHAGEVNLYLHNGEVELC